MTTRWIIQKRGEISNGIERAKEKHVIIAKESLYSVLNKHVIDECDEY